MTAIYIDADACPVREEVYRVASRLGVEVLVVSNGSRPLRPPGLPNVRMILVGDAPPFYFAEDYHQQYLAKNPFGYCGLGGTGVSCPVGTSVPA